MLGYTTLSNNPLLLWWVAIMATAAAVFTFYDGIREPHRGVRSRIMLSVAILGIAISYFWDIMSSDPVGPAELRSGAAIVVWPVFAWIMGQKVFGDLAVKSKKDEGA